jgi:hypothetical protein
MSSLRKRRIWEITVWAAAFGHAAAAAALDNFGGLLDPYGIAFEDVPSLLNIFQHMITRHHRRDANAVRDGCGGG